MGDKVAELFDRRGEEYSDAWKPKAKQKLAEFELGIVRRAVEEVLAAKGGGPIRVLDIGCGTGRIARTLLEYDIEYTGVDIAPAMVDLCREKFASNPKVKRIELRNALDTLPSEWGKFDLVTAIRVISYTPRWREIARNVRGVLNTGGAFVFTFPNIYSSAWISKLALGSRHLGNEVSLRGLRSALAEAGFAEVSVTGFARLLDRFYDWADTEFSASLLWETEELLRAIFGETFLARLFYVRGRK